jgi:hypothetical protein
MMHCLDTWTDFAWQTVAETLATADVHLAPIASECHFSREIVFWLAGSFVFLTTQEIAIKNQTCCAIDIQGVVSCFAVILTQTVNHMH